MFIYVYIISFYCAISHQFEVKSKMDGSSAVTVRHIQWGKMENKKLM